MAENSNIEWTHHTFNPWIGCTKVGPGCDHCYAELLSTTRLGVPWGPGAPRRHTAVSTWAQPRRWNKRCAAAGVRERVFCASLADVFDNEIDPEWRKDLGKLIRETPNLDWLLLTKRIGNALKMLHDMFDGEAPPANVFVGATIVNQAEWRRDQHKIAEVSVLIGKRRVFLSMEPLLGPVQFYELGRYAFERIVGWVIVGGESGPGARPTHPQWARDLRDQCAAAGVLFLFKQWGEWADANAYASETVEDYDVRGLSNGHNIKVGKKAAGRLLDGRTHDGFPVLA